MTTRIGKRRKRNRFDFVLTHHEKRELKEMAERRGISAARYIRLAYAPPIPMTDCELLEALELNEALATQLAAEDNYICKLELRLGIRDIDTENADTRY